MIGADSIRATVAAKARKADALPFTEETTAPIRGRSIREQWRMISWAPTSARRAAKLFCSRRSGKTVGLVKRVAKLSAEQRGRRTLYIHHTLGNAKKQFFDPPGEQAAKGLLGTLDAHGISHSDNNTEVCTELDNGSFVQVVGCDNMRQVGKKLGYFWDEIIIDECQEFDDDLLVLLVKKTLLPTLIDTHGTLIMAGTPSSVEEGFWFEVINNPDWELFHWTMMDNPLISRDSIREEMAVAGFIVDFENPRNNHVIVQREIFGLQVVDPAAFLYEYQAGRNDWPAGGIPFLDDKSWRYAMGIDIGGAEEGNDSDGVVVFGWRMDDGTHTLWERESHRWGGKERKDSEEFCTSVLDVFKRWQPMQSACGDTGGAGASKALVWLSKRMNGLEFTPKPTSVELSTRFLNDELRSGRMKVNPLGELCKGFKRALKGKHEPDVAAAGRYAFHGVYNWLAKDKPKPKPLEEQIEERWFNRWAKEEAELRSPYSQIGGWNLPAKERRL